MDKAPAVIAVEVRRKEEHNPADWKGPQACGLVEGVERQLNLIVRPLPPTERDPDDLFLRIHGAAARSTSERIPAMFLTSSSPKPWRFWR